MNGPSEADALFALLPGEFVAARNALAARLKKEGRPEEAQRVKALVKPSATAWAVNQLYWRHRREFDRLVAVSEKVRQAQSGRGGDLRSLVEERRAMVSALASTAAELLGEAGHTPSVDTRRRVMTTLESLAARDAASIEREAGRLTVDLEPLGFDSLAELLEGSPLQTAKVLDFRQGAAGKQRANEDEKQRAKEKQKAEAERAARVRAEAERAARAAALREAERALADARGAAKRAGAAAVAAEARREALEREKQELDARYAAAIEEARAAAGNVEKTARALADAERAVAAARDE